MDEALWMRVLMWIGFPLLGAGVGWSLKSVASWAVSLPWVPLQGPFELMDRIVISVGEPQATLIALAVGAVAGLGLALVEAHERLVVGVSEDRALLKRGNFSQEIPRRGISAVFLDGKELVLLGSSGEELARETSDLNPDRLRDAFLRHGLTWLEGDPYRAEYRLWVEGTPDLSPSTNALLRARAKALHRGDEGRVDAREIRSELSKLGVVVREEKKRQYWRKFSKHDSD